MKTGQLAAVRYGMMTKAQLIGDNTGGGKVMIDGKLGQGHTPRRAGTGTRGVPL